MKIGIVGGISPYACSLFYNRLCEEFRKAFSAFPELIIYSVKVDENQELEYIKDTVEVNCKNKLEEQLERACACFDLCKVDTVTIICNSLSDMFRNIANKYSFKSIITPLESIKRYAIQENKVLLLSTSYTRHLLFGGNIIKMKEKDIEFFEDIIQKKINGNELDFLLKKEMDKRINAYSPDSVILGCTDINRRDFLCETKYNIIDSSEIIVNEIISLYFG